MSESSSLHALLRVLEPFMYYVIRSKPAGVLLQGVWGPQNHRERGVRNYASDSTGGNGELQVRLSHSLHHHCCWCQTHCPLVRSKQHSRQCEDNSWMAINTLIFLALICLQRGDCPAASKQHCGRSGVKCGAHSHVVQPSDRAEQITVHIQVQIGVLD